MQIDITNNTQLTKNGEWANLGIGIVSPYTEEDGIFAGLYASTYDGLPVSKGFWAELDSGGNAVASIMADVPGLTNGAIRFAYTSGTRVITVYYDTDPGNGYQWIEYVSYGVDGSEASAAMSTGASWTAIRSGLSYMDTRSLLLSRVGNCTETISRRPVVLYLHLLSYLPTREP